MNFVLDSSVALTWCFEDERTTVTDALLERVTEAGAVAPMLWPLEILNGLAVAERRGRLDAQRRQRMTTLLHALPIAIDSETVRYAWQLTSHLAERFRLTVYDATYLELAQRMNLPLATLDQELRAAGATLGVPLLGLP